jgi:hypothetical protein
MPLTLTPTNRRTFLRRIAFAFAAAGSCLYGRNTGLETVRKAKANSITDPNYVALLADTHITIHPELAFPGTRWPGSPVADGEHVFDNMAQNLDQTVKEILRQDKLPENVIVNGDCKHGGWWNYPPKAYSEFVRLVKPLRDSGLPVHVTMGNHDDRQAFREAVDYVDAAGLPGVPEDKYCLIVNTPHARLFLIDTLPGELGEAQREWLGEALDKHNDMPAIVIGHHNPYDRGKPRLVAGVSDGESLMDLMAKRGHVKAYIFGHTHDWHVEERNGIHLINLPPVSYRMGPSRPTGWASMQIDATGAELTLNCIDHEHPDHNQRHHLSWRRG